MPPRTRCSHSRKAIAVGAHYIETDVHASSRRRRGDLARSGPQARRRPAGEGRPPDHGRAAPDRPRGGTVVPLARGGARRVPRDALQHRREVEGRGAADDRRDPRRQARSDRVLVSSFDERRRKAALRGLPGVVSSASAGGSSAPWSRARWASPPRARLAARAGRRAGSGRALGLQVTTDRMSAPCTAAGVEMHVWTVNDPRQDARAARSRRRRHRHRPRRPRDGCRCASRVRNS